MRISFLLLLLHLSLYLSAQRTYYVSGKGNDKNPGSMTSPFRSIKKVNTLALRPGDQVFFKSGEIFTGNLFLDTSDGGTKEAPAQIVSYGNGPATIAAGKKTAILVQDAGGIVIENLVVKGIGYAANDGSGTAVVNTLPGNKRLNYVRIRHIVATGFGRDIKKTSTGLIGEQSPTGQGIFVGGSARDKSKSGFNDILIDNCDTFENEFYGILISGFWQDKPSVHQKKNHVKQYLQQARMLQVRAEELIKHPPIKIGSEEQIVAIIEMLRKYKGFVTKFTGQIDHRLIKGEVIPAEEKIFSIFEEHTDPIAIGWLIKGKLNKKVELGHLLLITTDQYQFIVDYKVMENQRDAAQVSDLCERIKRAFAGKKIYSHSFDKGFFSKDNQATLQEAAIASETP